MQTDARMGALAAVIIAAISAAISWGACGGKMPPPSRGVLEHNIEAWNYRRYQQLLDVEVWVAENRAVAHTASYVRRSAEKEGRVGEGDVVSAFVTRYQSDRGILRSLVKFVRRLAQDAGYVVEERSRGGVLIISITGGNEAWAMWASEMHVVKIGGRGVDSVPADVIAAYGERYPSRLKEGVLDGPLPEGRDFGQPDEDGEYDPDNPTPDWDEFETGDPDSARDNRQRKTGKSRSRTGKRGKSERGTSE